MKADLVACSDLFHRLASRDEVGELAAVYDLPDPILECTEGALYPSLTAPQRFSSHLVPLEKAASVFDRTDLLAGEQRLRRRCLSSQTVVFKARIRLEPSAYGSSLASSHHTSMQSAHTVRPQQGSVLFLIGFSDFSLYASGTVVRTDAQMQQAVVEVILYRLNCTYPVECCWKATWNLMQVDDAQDPHATFPSHEINGLDTALVCFRSAPMI